MILFLLLAAGDDTYQRGKELFEQTYFEQATPLLQSFLDEPGDAPQAKQTRARWMLAQCLFFSGDKSGAAREIKRAPKGDAPGEKDWPPDFAAFVATHRAKSAPPPQPRPPPVKPKPKLDPPAVVDTPAPTTEPAVTPYVTPRLEARETTPAIAPWYLRGLPFGVGHFVAGDRIGGAIFLSLSTVMLASNIAFLVVNTQQRRADGTYPATSAYPALYVMQHVSAALFYLTAIASIIDGIVFVPGRISVTPGGVAGTF